MSASTRNCSLFYFRHFCSTNNSTSSDSSNSAKIVDCSISRSDNLWQVSFYHHGRLRGKYITTPTVLYIKFQPTNKVNSSLDLLMFGMRTGYFSQGTYTLGTLSNIIKPFGNAFWFGRTDIRVNWDSREATGTKNGADILNHLLLVKASTGAAVWGAATSQAPRLRSTMTLSPAGGISCKKIF